MAEPSSPTLLELDSRKRVSLGRLAGHPHYLATVFADGRILLEPAEVVSAAEIRLADDEAFWARVATAVEAEAVDVPDDLL